MIILMIAVFCCCVPMSMPLQHVVAFCGDLGFAPQRGAAMLSVLLGSAFLSRQFWGWLADRIGGLQTLLWASLAQVTALSGFLATQDEVALFAISSAFGLGMSGLLPAYVITIREFYPVREANWRVPTVLAAGFLGMAAGGWGAGALYDQFGYYPPAFSVGNRLQHHQPDRPPDPGLAPTRHRIAPGDGLTANGLARQDRLIDQPGLQPAACSAPATRSREACGSGGP
jgi:MFS family permease